MQNSERRRLYYKKYYQEHKDKYNKNWKHYYERRKALGIQAGDTEIYHTIDELKQAEIEEFGAVGNAINWDRWEALVEKTKEDITNALKDFKQPSKRKPIYCYTMTTKVPIIVFEDSDQAATTLNITRMQVTNACRTHKPIYYKGIILSYQPI